MEIFFTILKLVPAVFFPAILCALILYVNETVKREEEREGDMIRTKFSKSYFVTAMVFFVLACIIYATVTVLLFVFSAEFPPIAHALFLIAALAVLVVPTVQVLSAISTYEVIYEDGIRVKRLFKSYFLKYEDIYCYRKSIDQFDVFGHDCKRIAVIDNGRQGIDILFEKFADHGIYVYVDEEKENAEDAGKDVTEAKDSETNDNI